MPKPKKYKIDELRLAFVDTDPKKANLKYEKAKNKFYKLTRLLFPIIRDFMLRLFWNLSYKYKLPRSEYDIWVNELKEYVTSIFESIIPDIVGVNITYGHKGKDLKFLKSIKKDLVHGHPFLTPPTKIELFSLVDEYIPKTTRAMKRNKIWLLALAGKGYKYRFTNNERSWRPPRGLCDLIINETSILEGDKFRNTLLFQLLDHHIKKRRFYIPESPDIPLTDDELSELLHDWEEVVIKQGKSFLKHLRLKERYFHLLSSQHVVIRDFVESAYKISKSDKASTEYYDNFIKIRKEISNLASI